MNREFDSYWYRHRKECLRKGAGTESIKYIREAFYRGATIATEILTRTVKSSQMSFIIS